MDFNVDFFDENTQALRYPSNDLKNGFAAIAIQILASKKDLSKMSNGDILDETLEIIKDLQKVYQQKYYAENS